MTIARPLKMPRYPPEQTTDTHVITMSVPIPTTPPPAYTPQARRTSAYEQQQEQDRHGDLASGHGGGGGGGSSRRTRRRRKEGRARKMDPPPLVQKVGLAAQVYGLQGIMGTVLWLQGWREWFYPPGGGPNIVKAYEIRPTMGVRIFFPASYDLTSPQTLPTVLTIHGGGFCVGTARDDDEWNRAFADSQGMLVISLPYSKAPWAPFPAALHDLEALYLAVLGDESLPIDRGSSSSSSSGPRGKATRGRVAILGHDAGGNLALGLSQLPRVRGRFAAAATATTTPTAVVSVSGYLDLERPAADKAHNRPYKPGLPWPRGAGSDPLAATHEAYAWGYVPYGHELGDPLLSPAFATWGPDQPGVGGGGGGAGGIGGAAGGRRGAGGNAVAVGLPPHVCLVGAELDLLAHESWRLACRLVRDGGARRGDARHAGWRVPDPDADDAPERVCGEAGPPVPRDDRTVQEGEELELGELERGGGGGEGDGLSAGKRFGFEVRWPAGTGSAGDAGASVRWILVPDVLHGFDRAGAGTGQPVGSAGMHAYVSSVGKWLRETAWGM